MKSVRFSLVLATSLTLAACAGRAPHPLADASASRPVATAPATPHLVTVGIAAFNDFHGQLEPPRQSVEMPDGKGGTRQVPAGGAAWLASAIDAVRARYPNHLTVSAGDLTSASQVASSLYLDEPAVGVMNRIGIDFNAVGNHEFDRGRQELLRLQNGGCTQYTARKPCQLETFPGASYRYLAASTLDSQGHTLFPATGLKTFGQGADKVTIGVIGLTTRTTPTLVNPSGIAGLTFEDEAKAINAAIPTLKAQGADVIMVLIHEGGKQGSQAGQSPDPQGCAAMSGAILDIIPRLDPGVDLIVSGHTHEAYICDLGGKNAALDKGHPLLLTSAGLYGKMVTDITLQIDPATHHLVSRSAHNVIVQSQPYQSAKGMIEPDPQLPVFAPRADIAAYVGRYVAAAQAFANKPIGKVSGPAARVDDGPVTLGGSLGNLIADSQVAATRSAGAQIALTNPFGIRAALLPATDGAVTYGELYKIQPFNSVLITQTLTGAQLKAVLEQGFDDNGLHQALSPSSALHYTVDFNRPIGARVVRITIAGKPMVPGARYRVTVNNFLAMGGDTFTALADAAKAAKAAGEADPVQGESDLDALQAWIAAAPKRQIPAESRVTVIAAHP